MRTRYISPLKTGLSRPRIIFYFLMLSACFSLIVAGGVWRVTHFKQRLETRAQKTYHRSLSLFEHRGNIYGADQEVPLAMSTDDYHITADPWQLDREIRRSGKRAVACGDPQLTQRVARLLELPAEHITDKIRDTDRRFVYLKKKVSPAVAGGVKALNCAALRSEYVSARFYPNGESVAHIIGYTNHLGVGQGGVEYTRHRALSPKQGKVSFVRTAGGVPLREITSQPARYGNNIHLTIDSRLQYTAYDALRGAVKKHRASSAAAVVIDSRSGDLLAVASYPSFNPNNIRHEDLGIQNTALSHRIEPGSTIKPFVVALALEKRRVRRGETLSTSRPLIVSGEPLREDRIKEDLTVEGIIQRSSNIGAARLAQRLGGKPLSRFYRSLGLIDGIVLGLPDESGGYLSPAERWYERDLVNHAFGYGFQTTLLRLARAYSLFATDGALQRIRLHKEDRSGQLPLLSGGVARTVRRMMESVTQPGGTAPAAAIAGYRVAGKTGTVNKVIDGQYSDKQVRSFFIGLAPASQPRYVVAVMIDEPTRGGQYGGQVAAPAFHRIMRHALLLGGVPPDAPPQSET